MRILSMGAGVQTTACLIKYWDKYDYVVFADTGDEKLETYWYIDKYLKPFCREKGVKWKTVRWGKFDSLMDWCFKRKRVPFVSKRQCTQDFKVGPINRFCRSIGAKKRNPVYEHIGISIDESHRVNFGGKFAKNYVKVEYPLIDDKISREGCKQIIKDHGWPLPVKSGCDFCPFSRKSELRELAFKRPERFAKIVEMEKNNPMYPKVTIRQGLKMEEIINNQLLDDFIDDDEEQTCDSGHYFT